MSQIFDLGGGFPPSIFGYMRGVIPDASGPNGTGTDNSATINNYITSQIAGGITPPLPPGYIGVSAPIIISKQGTILSGSGQGRINAPTSALIGTTIVPLSNFVSPTIFVDTLGGTITNTNTYTSNAGSLPGTILPGMIVTITGAPGAVPVNTTVVSKAGNVLTLTTGCTNGAVTSLTVSIGAAVFCSVTYTGVRLLDIDVSTFLPQCLVLSNTDHYCSTFRCHGGTLACLDVYGNRNNIEVCRTENTANNANVYNVNVGPFTMRQQGADDQYVLHRHTGGTTQWLGGGQCDNVHFSLGTSGGPTVEFGAALAGVGNGTWKVDTIGLDANGTNCTCAIHHVNGKTTLSNIYCNWPPAGGANTPFVIEETAAQEFNISKVFIQNGGPPTITFLCVYNSGGNNMHQWDNINIGNGNLTSATQVLWSGGLPRRITGLSYNNIPIILAGTNPVLPASGTASPIFQYDSVYTIQTVAATLTSSVVINGGVSIPLQPAVIATYSFVVPASTTITVTFTGTKPTAFVTPLS